LLPFYPHPNLAYASFDLPTRRRWVEISYRPNRPDKPGIRLSGGKSMAEYGRVSGGAN